MPLHLLGKKSWNVYNADNIARVRRDEAAAQAAEEAEEQRMQEYDAERRLAILRGEEPPPLPSTDTEATSPSQKTEGDSAQAVASSRHDGPRKKRKRHGEDDTDFEMRLARERDNSSVAYATLDRKATSSAPITDRAGHIDLIGDERAQAHGEKNEEAEREARKKKCELEDQYTMRFTNAAGKDGIKKPWYSQKDDDGPAATLKDVWGNDDPQRKHRDTRRIAASDPLAMMKRGAAQVKDLKRERKKFTEEQERELRQLKREDRHREKRRENREKGRSWSREQRRGRDDDGTRERESRRRRGGEDDVRQRRSRSPGRRRHGHRHRD